MGMFGNLMGKVFGTSHPAATAPAPTPEQVASAPEAVAAQDAAQDAEQDLASAATAAVDYEAVLDAMNDKHPEELDWRASIVDLMKLVGMDSSLASRKELATELHYTGDMSDSASMNMWLHGQVMAIFAKNGGKATA
jgi:Domain of unknown function (DUF3597)